jgi:hypothetical protein
MTITSVMQSKDTEGSRTMNLSGKSIKHIILGLAMCSSAALVAPVSATQAASTHYDYPSYYKCGGYHGTYWGYTYGYYKGDDISSRLQGHDGWDDYDYGSYWYKGYYPDDEYWYFYSSEPSYTWRSHDGYQYRCFVPHDGYYDYQQGNSDAGSN